MRHDLLVYSKLFGMLAALVLGSTACTAAPTTSRPRADALVSAMAVLPGVRDVSADVTDRIEAGDPHVWISVHLTGDATPDQVSDVVSRYLSGIRTADFSGHLSELDVLDAGDRFAIDGGPRPVTNGTQIASQARDWVNLQRALPGATVDVRATVAHADATPDSFGHSLIGRVDLPEPAGSAAVVATVARLGADFAALTGGAWTVTGSKSHPSSVTAVGRLPTPRELDVLTAVDADQSIAHVSSLNVNAPQTPPVWVAERLLSHDPAVRFDLAAKHLPVIASLPAPVFYTATDQEQGYRDFFGRSTGPVAVTVGGCTARTYPVDRAEQQFVARYERCARA